MLRKEVLSDVFGIEVTKNWQDESLPNMIYYATKKSPVNNINIYELAFKCKEFILDRKSFIIEYTKNKTVVKFATTQEDKIFIGKNEIEAIFKATEWAIKTQRINNDKRRSDTRHNGLD